MTRLYHLNACPTPSDVADLIAESGVRPATGHCPVEAYLAAEPGVQRVRVAGGYASTWTTGGAWRREAIGPAAEAYAARWDAKQEGTARR